MPKFRKASADEARAKRQDHVRSSPNGDILIKGFRAPPSWDKEKRSARFIMTSESVDRYGDIVVQSGLEIDRFIENPQGLLFHNSRSWPCGNWSDVTKILNGRPKRTEGTLNFLPEGTDEDADRAARHVAAGTIRTVSIGFAPDWDEIEFILDEEGEWITGFKFNKSELLECSLVPIPAQPDALVKDAGGDFKLARELIEEVLDTYTRTPEGLLIPLDEYRQKHLDLSVPRSSFIIDKALAPQDAVRTASRSEAKVTADSDEDVKALAGKLVFFDPAHPENKESPCDILKDATGEIISAWIVKGGDFDGKLALAVEFLTDDWTGMFRGILAERFLLAKVEKDADEPAEMEPEEDAVETIGDVEGDEETKALETLLASVEPGESVWKDCGVMEREPVNGWRTYERLEGAAVVSIKAEDGTCRRSLSIRKFTDQHETLLQERSAQIAAAASENRSEPATTSEKADSELQVEVKSSVLERLLDGLAKLIGGTEKAAPERVEPVIVPAATEKPVVRSPEDTQALLARAAAARARVENRAA